MVSRMIFCILFRMVSDKGLCGNTRSSEVRHAEVEKLLLLLILKKKYMKQETIAIFSLLPQITCGTCWWKTGNDHPEPFATLKGIRSDRRKRTQLSLKS